MASVYYLFDDAIHVAYDIVQKYSQQDKDIKTNHYAAIIIQRSYRGYVARKKYQETRSAIKAIQRYTRGWLVRYHLPDFLAEYNDRVCSRRYHDMAARIQAVWRGLLVRKEVDIKKILEERRIQTLNALRKREEDNAAEGIKTDDGEWTEDPKTKYLKEKILTLLFDRHHLLSTQCRKGILQSNSELAAIEKVVSTLPWKNYMKSRKKIYDKFYKEQKNAKVQFTYDSKKLQRQEDVLRMRDRRNDKKDVYSYIGDQVIDNRKPFVLTPKPKKPTYERDLFSLETYLVSLKNITRTQDKSKNICDKDFELTLKRIVKESDVPPYYADFWYKECCLHFFKDM